MTKFRSDRVSLTRAELLQAALAGVMRGIEDIGVGHKYGADASKGWDMTIEGAFAECALAKHLGLYWAGKGAMREPDVGGIVDVRATRYETGKLIIHPDDPDDRPVFLLTGKDGKYRVRGWLVAGDGKKLKYWEELQPGRPAWCIPQIDLRPEREFWEWADGNMA